MTSRSVPLITFVHYSPDWLRTQPTCDRSQSRGVTWPVAG